MMIQELMAQKKITIYRLAKDSGIPYATINDICSGKAKLEKCTAETIYKIAKELGVSMETLLEPYLITRSSFELYKSNVCHRLKALGDIGFVMDTLEKDDITAYYQREWYPESLYLLAMLDYISRVNDLPLCSEYDSLRRCSLQEPLYPVGVLASFAVTKDESVKERARKEAIPEFMRFNIVESEVRDVL